MSGAIVWFTGLPSSGKSKLAGRVQRHLEQDHQACCVLDGDRIRALLHPPPGYTGPQRDDFYLTLGELAIELAQQGLVVLVAATANRRVYRDQVRARAAHFIEVWMAAPLDECRLRDAKGLYGQFAQGSVQGLPGEDLVYEAPESPELTAQGGHDDTAFGQILRLLKSSLALAGA
jgi:adenylylsulfate kinase